MTDFAGAPVLVSGGAGYIGGSHVVYRLRQAGFLPIVVDSLINGHPWATQYASIFRQGDIADVDLIRELCATYRPIAALHFAAFIEVEEIGLSIRQNTSKTIAIKPHCFLMFLRSAV